MVHLIQKGEKYFVVEVSRNHEVIKSSQKTGLTTRKAAYKNIVASAKHYADNKDNLAVLVQDDSGKTSRMLLVSLRAKKLVVDQLEQPAGKPYRPGQKSSGSAAKRKK